MRRACVEFEYEAALRRVVLGLGETGTVTTQREARYGILGHLGSLQVHVQLYVVHASVRDNNQPTNQSINRYTLRSVCVAVVVAIFY